MEPGLALSHIRDPIAVPYLAQLLLAKDRALGPILIDGLDGIADEPAVDALIAYVNSAAPDPDVRSVARGVLARIGSRTTDPAIQLRIRALHY